MDTDLKPLHRSAPIERTQLAGSAVLFELQ